MTQSQSLLEEEVQKDDSKPRAVVEVLYLTGSDVPVPSIQALQHQATDLLSEDGWISASLSKTPKLRCAGKSFIYTIPAPVYSVGKRKPRAAIPEWDDLSELPTPNPPVFESSDFLSTLYLLPNMWTLIPTPHLLTSPHHIPQLPPACPIEFDIGIKISPYARSTVYIPIFGSPLHARASSAMITQKWPPPKRVELLAHSRWDEEIIIWTARSIQRLWHFLIKIQEKGNCGPIGLSYQPSHLATREPPVSSEQRNKRAKLAISGKPDCAYIKVYCPSLLRQYLLHALRNFPASKDEDRRKPLLHARFASVEDNGTVSIG
ncbi:hypothetical protein CALCODRAFT_515686 [Calocera cornea HHB12733]|uniref:Uncharacterized protein n=1 Tax=Calocera cornea HHB12733 TaxID=1353952 RepID=A0A165I0C3_9BASI|nr:hypothetical protein CALCODRAFT_515686 [Calocera cornea HHB12733]